MGLERLISCVGQIRGVHRFVFVDSKGIIKGHNIGKPENFAKMIHACGRELLTLGKENFRYVSFSRESKKNILIFSVGNSFLGVVKQTGIDDNKVAEAVMAVISSGVKKRS